MKQKFETTTLDLGKGEDNESYDISAAGYTWTTIRIYLNHKPKPERYIEVTIGIHSFIPC